MYYYISKNYGLGFFVVIVTLITVMLLLEVMYTKDKYGLENRNSNNTTRTHTNSSGYVNLGLVGFIWSHSPVANTALEAYAENLPNEIQNLNNDVKAIEDLTGVLTLLLTVPLVPAVTISHREETHVDANLSPSTVTSTVTSSPTVGDPMNELEDVDIPSAGLVNDQEDDDFNAVIC